MLQTHAWRCGSAPQTSSPPPHPHTQKSSMKPWWYTCIHKRSSTHCPSSQGWASGVLLQSMYVVCCMSCVYCLVCWGEVSGHGFLSIASWLVCFNTFSTCRPRIIVTIALEFQEVGYHDLNHLRNARKEGKATQHNRKTKQHNTTQLAQDSCFQRKKLPRVEFEPTTVRLLGVRSYQLSNRGSLAGWARITYTIHSNQSTSTKPSQTR